MPPFKRKMILLVGAIGVGREALLKRLIKEVNFFLSLVLKIRKLKLR